MYIHSPNGSNEIITCSQVSRRMHMVGVGGEVEFEKKKASSAWYITKP